MGSIASDLPLAIVVSACLGALVGVVRQWTDWKEPHRDINFGGARTFTLWSVLGCLGAAASDAIGEWVLPSVVLAVSAHQIVAMGRHSRQRAGSTSFAAVLLTVLSGALVGWGEVSAAVVVTATTMIALGIKQPVHAWTRAFTREDVAAALQFVAVTGLILPLVPNRDMGPLQAFNPYTTWLMVVLISGVGFAGYVAIRILGTRAGILVSSVLGGIASSTATTFAFSRRSREAPPLSARYAVAVIIACVVMFARIGVIIAVLNRPLAIALILPFSIAVAPAILTAAVIGFVHRREAPEVDVPMVRNPLSLKTAIKFGVLYAIIAFVVKAVHAHHWTSGLLPISFISGLMDIDAIAVSLARTGRDALDQTVAAVLIASIANTAFKAGIALVLGTNTVRRHVSVGLGLTIAAGIVALRVT